MSKGHNPNSIHALLHALVYFQVEKIQNLLIEKGYDFSFHKTYSFQNLSSLIDNKLIADNQDTEAIRTITRGPARTRDKQQASVFSNDINNLKTYHKVLPQHELSQ